MNSSVNSPAKQFSHIYVERSVRDTKESVEILQKFKSAKIIEIEHYKDIFNRANQNFDTQAKSKKLILARREPPYLQKGSKYSDDFGFEQFFYISTMFGCLYDCSYCYLQGLYNSANIVIFVNIDEHLNAIKQHLSKPTLVAISYDTDTLAVESIAKHTEAWLNLVKQEPNLNIEVRTKSSAFKAIQHLDPTSRATLAWSLSPQTIIDAHESRTASLQRRLDAIKNAILSGWQVRICIDPVIYCDDFKREYCTLIDTIFKTIDPAQLHSLTIGSFRMSSAHLKSLKRLSRSSVAFYPYSVQNQTVSYPKEIEQFVLTTLKNRALEYIDAKKIRVWEL